MREGLWIMVEVEGHRRLFDEMTFELKHKDEHEAACEDLEADLSSQRA